MSVLYRPMFAVLRSLSLPAIAAAFALSTAPGHSEAAQHALLVGVSDYTDPRLADLEGPVNDVESMRDILVDTWQFSPENITTLINEQATESAILSALDALMVDSSANDDIIIYFSGHGTSARDIDLGARINLPDGSGAIVASDFNPDLLVAGVPAGPSNDGLLVGRHELRPRFKALDQQRNVLIMFDACFSGNTARSVPSAYRPKNTRQLRFLNKLAVLINESMPGSDTDKTNSQANADTQLPFEYKNTVYFGAAAEDQFAVDFSQAEIDAGLVDSFDGKPHGGFTDSLLRVLGNPANRGTGSAQLSHATLFNRVVNKFNNHCSACGHTPVSLPVFNTESHELLNRVILTAAEDQTTGQHTQRNAPVSNAPAHEQELIVGDSTFSATGLPLAQLLNTRSAVSTTQESSGPPDIYFEHVGDVIQARAASGQLIKQFPDNVSQSTLQAWLKAQSWLKKRLARDLQQERGTLRVDFRQPLYGNQVTEGDYIHFTVSSSQDARLVALLLDAGGKLSVLYPVTQSESAETLIAGRTHRIPAIDQLQIQVTPPWGTDVVLFYALDTDSPLVGNVLSMAADTSIAMDDARLTRFESQLDENAIAYSSSSVRIVSSELP